MRNIFHGDWAAVINELRSQRRRLDQFESRFGGSDVLVGGRGGTGSPGGGGGSSAHAHRHATGGSTKSDTGADPLRPYTFTWDNAHTWEPGHETRIPIRVVAHADQSADLTVVDSNDDVHLFQIDASGRVALQAPAALGAWLTIRNPGVGAAQVLLLGPAGWWAADDPLDNGGSSTPSNGQEITTNFASWADISGNNRDQTASTASAGSRPAWYNAAGASPAPPSLPNSKPVFSFISRTPGSDTFSNISLSDLTIYAVAYLSSNSGPVVGSRKNGGSFDDATLVRVQTITGSTPSRIETDSDIGDNSQIQFVGTNNFTGTNWRRVMFRRTGSTWTHEIDDTDIAVDFTSNPPGDGLLVNILMSKVEDAGGGPTNRWDTWVAEIIVFSSALSPENQAIVESYLDAKYGTGSGTPPAGAYPLVQFKSFSDVVLAEFDESGRLHIGGENPDALLEVTGTTEQARLSHNASNYASFTVDSAGDLTVAPTGGDIFVTGSVRVTRTTEQLQVRHDPSNYLTLTVGSAGSTTLDLVGTSPEFTFSDEVNLDGGSQHNDSDRAFFGTDKDASIFWDGTSVLAINPKLLGSGRLEIQGNSDVRVLGANGNVELLGNSGGHIIGFTRGGENFISATTAGGDINFRVNASNTIVGKFTTTGLRFDDTLGLKFGTGADIDIKFNGTSFIIDAPNGDTIIISSDTQSIQVDGSTGISFSGALDIGQSYVEFEERAVAPSSPSANNVRMFLSQSTGELSVKKDDGSIVSLESGGTAGQIAVAGPVVVTAAASGITGDRYLNIDGIQGTNLRSYVPTRTGSITGVSCSITAGAVSSHGTIDIEVHKNGVSVFSAQVTTSGSVDQTWLGTQAAGIDTFGTTDELALYINFGTFSGTITAQASMELVFDQGMTDVIKKVEGSSGGANANYETYQVLTADSSDITTATLSSSLMTLTGVGAGTWRFIYHIIYQTDDANNGIGFGLNHSGTVTSLIANWRHVTTGSSDTTGVADSVAGTVTGQMVEGKSGSTVNAVIGSTSTGADAADTSILAVLEGIIIVSATGQLELKIASENAGTAVRLKTGTCLQLIKLTV